MKITISGFPGAGKTTTGKTLAKKLSHPFLSIGDLRGTFAKTQLNKTIDELNAMNNPKVDLDFDKYQQRYGRENPNFVIEGRLSFYFVPDSIKIFLDVKNQVGIQRIFKEQRSDEKKVNNLKEMELLINRRIQSDKQRYKKLYDLDCYDKKHYDIIVDTTKLTSKESVAKIRDYLNI